MAEPDLRPDRWRHRHGADHRSTGRPRRSTTIASTRPTPTSGADGQRDDQRALQPRSTGSVPARSSSACTARTTRRARRSIFTSANRPITFNGATGSPRTPRRSRRRSPGVVPLAGVLQRRHEQRHRQRPVQRGERETRPCRHRRRHRHRRRRPAAAAAASAAAAAAAAAAVHASARPGAARWTAAVRDARRRCARLRPAPRRQVASCALVARQRSRARRAAPGCRSGSWFAAARSSASRSRWTARPSARSRARTAARCTCCRSTRARCGSASTASSRGRRSAARAGRGPDPAGDVQPLRT